MRSPDPRRTRLVVRRRALASLMAAASLLGFGGTLPANAQAGEADGPTGDELFGAYALEARGIGVEGSYEIEGLLPGGSAVLDLGLPETLARFGSGPSGYGLASLAYPGGLIANFGSLVAQSGGPPDGVPPYPIKAEAFYPAGPTEADGSQGGGVVQKVVTTDHGVQVDASYPALEAPPIVSVGSITSASRTAIEGDLAVGRTRVVLGDVRVLGGLITIDALATDLVAVHNGATGSTAGGTTASGVRFLGLEASLTEDGFLLKQAPPTEGPAAPLGGALSGTAEPLSGITGPVQDQLRAVLAQATPQLDDLLAQAGIEMRMLDPREVQVDSGAASRFTTGLALKLSYKGREQQAMVDLINSIPAELKPNFGPIPNPVTFLAENHITGVSLAPASVSALATPPFATPDFPLPNLPTDFTPADPTWVTTLGSPGFTTPAAPLPEPASAGAESGPLTEPVSVAVAGAVPAILVALALLASPLFAVGSGRLADSILAPTGSYSCSIGPDKPPAPPRPS